MTSYFAKVTKSQINVCCLKCQKNEWNLTFTCEFLYHNTDEEGQPIDITVNTRGSPCHQLHYMGTHSYQAQNDKDTSSLVSELLRDQTLGAPKEKSAKEKSLPQADSGSASKENESANSKKKTDEVDSGKASQKAQGPVEDKLPKKRVYGETIESNPENPAGDQNGAITSTESVAARNVESDSKKRRKAD